jgi:hypothetical protein
MQNALGGEVNYLIYIIITYVNTFVPFLSEQMLVL